MEDSDCGAVQRTVKASTFAADLDASHYAELWYVFDHLNQESWQWSAADRKLAEQMSSYWINFAKAGDPNRADLPSWPAFGGGEGKVLHIGDRIIVDAMANLANLRIFDVAYDNVRGAPFAVQ